MKLGCAAERQKRRSTNASARATIVKAIPIRNNLRGPKSGSGGLAIAMGAAMASAAGTLLAFGRSRAATGSGPGRTAAIRPGAGLTPVTSAVPARVSRLLVAICRLLLEIDGGGILASCLASMFVTAAFVVAMATAAVTAGLWEIGMVDCRFGTEEEPCGTSGFDSELVTAPLSVARDGAGVGTGFAALSIAGCR